MKFAACVLTLLLVLVASARGAVLRGIVLLNELEGPPVPNVSVSADGAQPKVSDNEGCFELDFGKDRDVGDRVEIRVKKDDFVVIHSILLQQPLLKDTQGSRAKIIIAREGEREEMARRYFRLKGDAAAEDSYKKQLEELERRHQANAANVARLQQELAQAKAAAEKTSEGLARESGEKTSPLYQQALKQHLDGKLDAALETLEEEKLEKRKAQARQTNRQISQEYRLRAHLLTLKFRFAEATRAYQSAVATASDDFEAHFDLGYFAQSLNRHNDALAAYTQALKLARNDDDADAAARTLNNLGSLLRVENRMSEAHKAFDEALEIRRQLAEKNPDKYLGDVADTLNNLGNLHGIENRMAKARMGHEEALPIRRQLAEKNPDKYLADVALTLNNLGALHHKEDRRGDALKAYEDALKIRRELAEKNPDRYLPDVAATLNNLGVLYSDENRMADARQAYEDALTIYRQLVEKNPEAYLPYLAVTLSNLGENYDEKHMNDARRALEDALTIQRRLAKENPDAFLPAVAETLDILGSLDRDEGRIASALRAYEEALRIRRQLAKKSPNTYLPDVAETLTNLGVLRSSQNDMADARTAYKNALKIYQQFEKIAPARFSRDVRRVEKLIADSKK